MILWIMITIVWGIMAYLECSNDIQHEFPRYSITVTYLAWLLGSLTLHTLNIWN